MIGCVRSLGLAARYVSGYIETLPPPGQERLVGADASHAWASVYLPGWGWVDVDPTNDQFVAESYITTAWGRDYWDVSPLRGSVEGGGGSHRPGCGGRRDPGRQGDGGRVTRAAAPADAPAPDLAPAGRFHGTWCRGR